MTIRAGKIGFWILFAAIVVMNYFIHRKDTTFFRQNGTYSDGYVPNWNRNGINLAEN
jgi:hypothetical protein